MLAKSESGRGALAAGAALVEQFQKVAHLVKACLILAELAAMPLKLAAAQAEAAGVAPDVSCYHVLLGRLQIEGRELAVMEDKADGKPKLVEEARAKQARSEYGCLVLQ